MADIQNFMFDDEEFQIYKPNDNTWVVLSALATLDLSELGEGNKEVDYFIYAENIKLSKSFSARSVTLCVKTMEFNKGTVINTSGSTPITYTGVNIENKKAQNGANGTNGGEINLYLEEAINSFDEGFISLQSNGGEGENGQDSVPADAVAFTKAAGGNGGNGGNGGKVTVNYTNRYFYLLNRLVSIDALSDVLSKRLAYASFYQFWISMNPPGPADDQKLALEIYELLPTLNEGNLVNFTAKVQKLGNSLNIKCRTWQNNELLPSLEVNEGSYGDYGICDATGLNGENGKKGKPGEYKVEVIDSDGLFNLSAVAPYCFAHPDQCQMLLNKAQLLYAQASPTEEDENLHLAMNILLRLRQRLTPFVDTASIAQLTELYSEYENLLGTIDCIPQFQRIYDQSAALLNQLESGNDFFNNSFNYVPLGSFDFYHTQLQAQLISFEKIETDYVAFFNAERSDEERMEAVKRTRTKLMSTSDSAQGELEQIQSQLYVSAKQISAFAPLIRDAQKELEKKFNIFEDALKSKNLFSLKTLIEPFKLIVSTPKGPFKWGKAIVGYGLKVNKEFKTIKDDGGKVVEKKYLLKELDYIHDEVKDLDEFENFLAQKNDGLIELPDEEAEKLVFEKEKLESLLKSFYKQFTNELDEVKLAFENYIDIILSRNNQVLNYNSLVLSAAQRMLFIQQAQDEMGKLDDEALRNYQPNLPIVTSFMSTLYRTMLNQTMHLLYLVERSYQYWSLSSYSPVNNMLRQNPVSHISSTLLTSVYTTLNEAYRQSMESFGVDAQAFPALNTQAGVKMSLSKGQLDDLRRNHSVLLSVKEVMKEDNLLENPFASMANIRLSKIRFWAKGLNIKDATVNRVVFTLTQMSRPEIVVSQDNNVLQFTHEVKKINFAYNPEDMEIFQDGLMNRENYQSNYAPVGPFSHWLISLEHPDLYDLETLEEANIEFHGTSYAFY